MQGQASQDIFLDETRGIQSGMVLDKGVAQAGLELLPLPIQRTCSHPKSSTSCL